MSRLKENEELINKVNSCFESMEQASPLELAGVRDALNLFIQLDISRSLAVIADALQAEKEAE